MATASGNPKTVAYLLRQLKRAKKLLGSDTRVGARLSGDPTVWPIQDIIVGEDRQRVTIIINFTDKAQRKHAGDLE